MDRINKLFEFAARLDRQQPRTFNIPFLGDTIMTRATKTTLTLTHGLVAKTRVGDQTIKVPK